MIEYADVIVDLAYGDSGKGKITYSLGQDSDYTHCIRYNGSNNAGHTIYHNNQKIVTHSIPTGIIHGIKSIIGPGCVLNVPQFLTEVKELEDAGIKTSGLIYVANNVHIITEAHLQEDGKDKSIGTTKRGNGPAYKDKYSRTGIRAESVPELKPYLIDMYQELHGPNPCRILFEGAQGFGLDIDWGDYPYVTSSNCTVAAAINNGVPHDRIRNVWGVAKVYETYVGAKKFEPNDAIFAQIRELGAEYGATTGRPRQCNWLNTALLKKAVDLNGVTHVVFNKADILRKLNVWKAYSLDGELLEFSDEYTMRDYLEKLFPDVVIWWSDNPNSL